MTNLKKLTIIKENSSHTITDMLIARFEELIEKKNRYPGGSR